MPDPYEQFLAACIRRDSGMILRELTRQPAWNWEALLSAASDEALLPALHSRLSQLPISPSIPPEVLEFLLAVEFLNRERNATIFGELKHAAMLLNQAGLHPVLLKGVAYTATATYPDPAARYIGDIDLLVPEPQMQVAVETLAQNHYQRDDRDPFGPFRHHHPPLYRAAGARIELHHSLGLGKCARLLAAREVIGESLPHDLDGASVRIPCPEHLATHLIMHSQIHHSYTERIWPPLRAMWDLASLDRRYGADLNWSGIQARFSRAGEHGLLILHLMQISTTLGTPPPIVINPTTLTRLRWSRRRLLRHLPPMRYLDPVYMSATILGKRLRMLRHLLASRGGCKWLTARATEPQVYARLWSDLVTGRGR